MSTDRELAFLLNDCVKMGETLRMRDGWFLIQNDDDFPKTDADYQKKYPSGTDNAKAINGFAFFTEMMGMYVRRGWIPADVMKEFVVIKSLWPKLQPLIEDMRKAYGMDDLYIDTEYLANL